MASPRRWLPVKAPFLARLDLLLVRKINPLLDFKPNLPSELIAAMQVPLGGSYMKVSAFWAER